MGGCRSAPIGARRGILRHMLHRRQITLEKHGPSATAVVGL
jgi:hypothetical protein